MGSRLESWTQVLIMLLVGGMAGAVSFVHVHDWTVTNGQPSWGGWTNAIVTELTQIAVGLEVRRRKRTGQRTRFAVCVLIAAAVVSLTAQVSQAQPTASGWLVAALPTIGFLTVVKIVMARTAVTALVTAAPVSTGRHAEDADLDRDRGPDLGPVIDQRPDRGPGHADQPDRTRTAPAVTTRSEPGPDPVTPEDRTAPDPTPDRTAGPPAVEDPVTPTSPPARTASLTDEFDPDLVALGREVLTDLTDRGQRVNRGTFAMGIRAAGGTVATNTAGHLLRALREETAA